MEIYFQTLAAALVAVILALTLKKGNAGIAELMVLLMCCMVVIVAIRYIDPIIGFIRSVQVMTTFHSDAIKILLKAVGVSVTTEIAALMCSDSGNKALGKALEFLSSTVIVWLTLPLMTQLLSLINEVLNGI